MTAPTRTDQECALTELPATMCAHCRGIDKPTPAEIRARRQANPTPDHVTHGTASAYQTYGCRCDLCLAYNRSASYTSRHRTGRSTWFHGEAS